MNALEIIRFGLHGSGHVLSGYISDMSDEELLTRPADGANTAAWQIGHLLVSENAMANAIKPGTGPTLSPKFLELHSKENARADGPFATKAEYLSLMKEQREATLALLSTVTEEMLDQPGPESMRNYAPTFGALLLMISQHEMLHAGQIAVLRRRLDKPIVM